MCLIFRGSFNYKLFQKAYHLIIKRHEILRSAIIMDRASAGIFSLQSIYPQVNPIMAFYDYENLPPQQKNKLFKLFLNDDFLTPFNFNIPPLMRLTTIRFSDQEHRIIWTRHHILLDGASVALILSELLTIYSALLHNMSWQLPICYSYHDIKEKLCLKDRIKAALYWKKQLNLFSESALLPAIPQNNTTTNNFSQLQSELGGDDYQILLAFVDRWELTINSILQAAWGIVLSHYSNNRHVIFGSVRAYPKEETADAVGLFINTLPLSLTINPNSVVVDYLRAVREQGKALREYVHTPLSDLREWCGLALDEMLYQSIVDYKPYSLNKLIKTQFSDMNCESSLRLTIPYPLVIEGVRWSRYLVIDFSHPWLKSTRQRAKCLTPTVLRPARCAERASVCLPQ